MLETASSRENISNAESSTPSILKIKRSNKIHSPPPLSPSLSVASSDVSDLFQAKKKKLPPVPKPRLINKENQQSKVIETSFSETQSVPSIKSEAISYKEQLRNRFLSVKKQAGSSISHTPISKTSTRKRYSIDDTILVENNVIENELKKRQLKSANVEESFDFFCKVFTDDKKQVKSKNILHIHYRCVLTSCLQMAGVTSVTSQRSQEHNRPV